MNTAGAAIVGASGSVNKGRLDKFEQRSRSPFPVGAAAQSEARILKLEQKTIRDIGRALDGKVVGRTFLVLGLIESTSTMVKNINAANSRIYGEQGE